MYQPNFVFNIEKPNAVMNSQKKTQLKQTNKKAEVLHKIEFVILMSEPILSLILYCAKLCMFNITVEML